MMLPPSLADENPYLVEVVVELGTSGYHYTGPEGAWSNSSSTSPSTSTASCATRSARSGTGATARAAPGLRRHPAPSLAGKRRRPAGSTDRSSMSASMP